MLAVWHSQELTTTMLFYKAPWLAPSRSYSKCRTTQLRLCFKHQDDPMPSFCFTVCTSCWWQTGRTVQKMETVAFKVQHTATSAYPTGPYRPTNACTTYGRWQQTLVNNFLCKPMIGFSSSACCKLVQLCILLGRTKTSHIPSSPSPCGNSSNLWLWLQHWNMKQLKSNSDLSTATIRMCIQLVILRVFQRSNCEYIFLLVNHRTPTSLHEHVFATVLCKWVLHCSSLHSVCELYDFWTVS